MALCQAWGNGDFNGSLKDLHENICQQVTGGQQPQYGEYGQVNDYFRDQGAFAVAVAGPTIVPAELAVLELDATPADLLVAGDIHQYRFTVRKDGRYVIETVGDTDLSMDLYGPDNLDIPMARDDDGGDKYNPRIAADLKAGTYIVHIKHFNTSIGTGQYGIRVWC